MPDRAEVARFLTIAACLADSKAPYGFLDAPRREPEELVCINSQCKTKFPLYGQEVFCPTCREKVRSHPVDPDAKAIRLKAERLRRKPTRRRRKKPHN